MRKLPLAIALLAGCGGSMAQSDMLIDPGPVPANGMQLILPIHKGIRAGSDNELCTWTEVTADKDIYIKTVQSVQSDTGHHVAVYKTKSYEPAGTTRPCTDDDMASFRYVSGADGEGIGEKNVAPGNLAFAIEKGFQIVINEHFLNASPRDVDGQSAVNFEFAPLGQPVVVSSSFVMVDTKLNLPKGQSEIEISCKMERDYKAWLIFPHMHRWGTHARVEHTDQMGVTRQLFNLPWDAKYTFEPPELRTDVSTPMVFSKGDTLKLHCRWDNTTGKALTFGMEMCVFLAQFADVNKDGNRACDRGEWTDF